MVLEFRFYNIVHWCTVNLKPLEGRRNSLKRDSFRRKLARNQARQASSSSASTLASKRTKDHEIAADFTGHLTKSGEEKATCLFMTQSLSFWLLT